MIALSRIVNLIVESISKIVNYKNFNNKFEKLANRVLITQKKEKKQIKIPTWLMVSILLVYIIFGGYLFTFEGWNYTNAIYFIFASISSIGFGDFVPGKSDKIWYIIGIIYIIIGKLLLFSTREIDKYIPINRHDTIWNGYYNSRKKHKFRIRQF